MAADPSRWRKLKGRDIPKAENLLRAMEEDCVSACSRFISTFTGGRPSKSSIWALEGEGGGIAALIMNCRNMVMPVLCGMERAPPHGFPKSIIHAEYIHSLQGLKNEVLLLENEFTETGRLPADIFDYDLMSLNSPPLFENRPPPAGLVLRVPQMTDINELAPLQAAYEKEEVLPNGSVFKAAASRAKLANIIADGCILAAEINGRIVAKINVNAVSFTRCQIGGVYVRPDFRGRGIARVMAREFISSLISGGWGVTLFVKKSNAPARRLYAGLGFKARGDYRITYY